MINYSGILWLIDHSYAPNTNTYIVAPVRLLCLLLGVIREVEGGFKVTTCVQFSSAHMLPLWPLCRHSNSHGMLNSTNRSLNWGCDLNGQYCFCVGWCLDHDIQKHVKYKHFTFQQVWSCYKKSMLKIFKIKKLLYDKLQRAICFRFDSIFTWYLLHVEVPLYAIFHHQVRCNVLWTYDVKGLKCIATYQQILYHLINQYTWSSVHMLLFSNMIANKKTMYM